MIHENIKLILSAGACVVAGIILINTFTTPTPSTYEPTVINEPIKQLEVIPNVVLKNEDLVIAQREIYQLEKDIARLQQKITDQNTKYTQELAKYKVDALKDHYLEQHSNEEDKQLTVALTAGILFGRAYKRKTGGVPAKFIAHQVALKHMATTLIRLPN
ncbi:MAG: hypothetical protein HRU25_12915 [Psychrobium sp.]|nr:hypothetical protein [Psychrobium sp.]